MSGGQDGDAGASRAPPLAIAGTGSTPPRLLPLGFFFVAYLLGAGLANRLSLHPETSLAIWAPAGLYLAALVLAPPRHWAWWAAASFGAELLANALWFRQPVGVAVLINAGNALAAIAGAALLLRLDPTVARLASLRSVLLLVVVGALGAQVVAATMGAATAPPSVSHVGAWSRLPRPSEATRAAMPKTRMITATTLSRAAITRTNTYLRGTFIMPLSFSE